MVKPDLIQRRKKSYSITPSLRHYLHHFGRLHNIPLVYDDLFRFENLVPYESPDGEETLWLTVGYNSQTRAELYPKLTEIYAMLKIGGDLRFAKHLVVERVDFGEFGNSRPFRIRITNQFNGNSDYYYVKLADTSRIYGLEWEHLLSPNRLNYLVNGNTLIEEHVAGVPGNVFIRDYLNRSDLNRVRIAKEFVKFGERSYVRLLGDMRSVNYVVDITPDFEEVQYRVRAIDFDQQSYEGNLEVYRAQLFHDNGPVERLVRTELNPATIRQYRSEERSQMARRAQVERQRITALLVVMRKDTISEEKYVELLKNTLAEKYQKPAFKTAKNMGEILTLQLNHQLETSFLE